MKRKSTLQLQRELLLARERTRRQLKRRLRRYTRSTRVHYRKGRDQPASIVAPRVFDLDNPQCRSELLDFLRTLRRLIVKERRDVRIAFVETQRMIVGGTLLFTAELIRLKNMAHHSPRILCTYPRRNKVEQVLQQIGVLKLLNKEERLIPDAEDVIHWRFIDGSLAEGEKANRLIEAFADKLPPSLSRGLYNGLVEAMTNCVHHAYLDERADGIYAGKEQGWWMFAQERDGHLSFAFCDLGIGIPRSLPKTHDPNLLETIQEKLGRAIGLPGYQDVDFIAMALELGKTRTRKTHRGLGLLEFRDVVQNAGTGYVRIYSNKGCYTFSIAPNGEATEHRVEHIDSILGTLIHWRLPLNQP